MPQQECVICEETITNPICPECLAKQMEQWLDEKDSSIRKDLNELLTAIKSYSHETTRCIICGNNMNICSHCFSDSIYKWLMEIDSNLAQPFMKAFNYELI